MKLYLRQRLHMDIQSQSKRSEIFIHSTYCRNHWRVLNKVIKMYRQGRSSDYMQNEVIQRLSRRVIWGIFLWSLFGNSDNDNKKKENERNLWKSDALSIVVE